MSDPQTWPAVIAELQRRLAEKGYPTKLWWVFREDLLESNESQIVLCRRPRRGSEALAEHVFERGRSLGFVRVVALARLFNHSVVTVWYPDVSREEMHGWGQGAWIKIRKPLRRAIRIPGPFWFLLKTTSAYRTYQYNGWTVGTRQWAIQVVK